jgi:hypothetical protein
VSAFVDWQSQLINSGVVGYRLKRRAAEEALHYVVGQIAGFLASLDSRTYFFVETKIYHGWHRGLSPTENFLALKGIFADGVPPVRVGQVSFGWQSPFGSILSNCFEHRLHPVLRIHLPNTLRPDFEHAGGVREKMTDTALVCDVLSSTRSAPTEIRLILGEDDDLIPAAFVAERWAKERGGRTFILRTRGDAPFLNLEGIYKQMRVADA